MSDRIPSDHDAVESHRVHLEAVGRTSRLRIPLPEDVAADPEDVLGLSLAGDEYSARVETTLENDRCIETAADNARLARAGEGENRLAAWLATFDANAGDPVLVDVVTPGYKLGVREPGTRVVYAATDPPSDSLSTIAAELDE